jgi:hypothetical protein
MARWLVAYCFASKWALREEGRRRADLEGWLAPRELDAMVRGGGGGGGFAGRVQAWLAALLQLPRVAHHLLSPYI